MLDSFNVNITQLHKLPPEAYVTGTLWATLTNVVYKIDADVVAQKAEFNTKDSVHAFIDFNTSTPYIEYQFLNQTAAMEWFLGAFNAGYGNSSIIEVRPLSTATSVPVTMPVSVAVSQYSTSTSTYIDILRTTMESQLDVQIQQHTDSLLPWEIPTLSSTSTQYTAPILTSAQRENGGSN